MKAIEYWIVPSNLKVFDVKKALKDNKGLVDWRVSCHMAVGDVVFLYISKPEHCVRYMMEVAQVDLNDKTRYDQEHYWLDKKAYRNGLDRNLVRLKLLREYNDNTFSFHFMREHGLRNNLQGPARCPQELLDCFLKKE